jgi:hypothetical protein
MMLQQWCRAVCWRKAIAPGAGIAVLHAPEELRPVPAVVRQAVLGRPIAPPVPAMPCCAPEELRPVAAEGVTTVQCALGERPLPPPGASSAVLCAEGRSTGGAVQCAGRKRPLPQCQQVPCCAPEELRPALQRWCRSLLGKGHCPGSSAVLAPEELRPVPAVVPCSALGEGHYSASSAVLCARKTETQCQQWCRAVLGRKSPLPPSASSAVLCEELRPVPAVVPCSAGEKPVL